VKPWIVSLLLVTALTGPALAATKPAKSDKSDKKAAAAPDSLKLLEQAVAKDSTKFENLLAVGAMYLDRDRPVEAQRALLKANQVRPRNMKVLVNLGAAYDAQGNADVAQKYYREALTVTPGDELATCRLASSLYAQSKQSDAVQLLRDMIREKPKAYCAYFTMGVAFADAGIYREAIRMWKKVVELAPDSPEAASARESIDVLQKFVGI
jgi:tetratricopeptide (TPR) repeat protein